MAFFRSRIGKFSCFLGLGVDPLLLRVALLLKIAGFTLTAEDFVARLRLRFRDRRGLSWFARFQSQQALDLLDYGRLVRPNRRYWFRGLGSWHGCLQRRALPCRCRELIDDGVLIFAVGALKPVGNWPDDDVDRA